MLIRPGFGHPHGGKLLLLVRRIAKPRALLTSDRREQHMPERDGYIPGLPCWVDTSQPDPEASLDFYQGLFGWEFESVMPPDSPGKYFMARIRGGDVAAIGSIPEGAPSMATWNT